MSAFFRPHPQSRLSIMINRKNFQSGNLNNGFVLVSEGVTSDTTEHNCLNSMLHNARITQLYASDICILRLYT